MITKTGFLTTALVAPHITGTMMGLGTALGLTNAGLSIKRMMLENSRKKMIRNTALGLGGLGIADHFINSSSKETKGS